ncbi:DUF3047 domain-containing protein [Oceanospirillum linum]|uniref:DUF3047 domain-containing protein n=1 Tax=Oceanospirillum linum TaxID=966 RepID=A0A1T1HAI5_OCELI|nr:DUF3047 domain-containing protein [Oceanospirillum linum]OOV86869.1 hypothetical protein BTA35_0211265 [Oceanospirillum linum]SEG20364.1 Protein of unknown function [Oleiphilus messinensis]SMP24399.1 Protein of unknown function [Oceanospirillum linum]
MRLISHCFVNRAPGFSGVFPRVFTFIVSLLMAAMVAERAQAESSLRFTPDQIIGWQAKEFEGHTAYQLKQVSENNVVQALSQGTASGLFYETEIDLNKTPYLSWRWKVTQLPELGDEKIKSGDDFAARVYIVVNDGWTFLSTKAISYVWSAKSPEGDEWANPFTGSSAMMVSVRQQEAGEDWYTEKRNLKADLKRLFGKDIETVKAVAIMTDTDNSQSSAEAWYGDLVFSAQ